MEMRNAFHCPDRSESLAFTHGVPRPPATTNLSTPRTASQNGGGDSIDVDGDTEVGGGAAVPSSSCPNGCCDTFGDCRRSHAALAKRVTKLCMLTETEVDACLVVGGIAPTPGAMLCGVSEFIDVWHQGKQRTTALGSTCERGKCRCFKQATRVVIVVNNQKPTKQGFHSVVFVADITSRTVCVYDSWRRGNLSLEVLRLRGDQVTYTQTRFSTAKLLHICMLTRAGTVAHGEHSR